MSLLTTSRAELFNPSLPAILCADASGNGWGRTQGEDGRLQRFFFHRFRSGQWMPDLDGRKLADLDEAITVSVEALEELHLSAPTSAMADQRVVVTDALGDELYVAEARSQAISP